MMIERDEIGRVMEGRGRYPVFFGCGGVGLCLLAIFQ